MKYAATSGPEFVRLCSDFGPGPDFGSQCPDFGGTPDFGSAPDFGSSSPDFGPYEDSEQDSLGESMPKLNAVEAELHAQTEVQIVIPYGFRFVIKDVFETGPGHKYTSLSMNNKDVCKIAELTNINGIPFTVKYAKLHLKNNKLALMLKTFYYFVRHMQKDNYLSKNYAKIIHFMRNRLHLKTKTVIKL